MKMITILLLLFFFVLVSSAYADVLWEHDCSAVGNWVNTGSPGSSFTVSGGRCVSTCGSGGTGATSYNNDPNINITESGTVYIDFVDWKDTVTDVDADWMSLAYANQSGVANSNIAGFHGLSNNLWTTGYSAGSAEDTGWNFAVNTNYNITIAIDSDSYNITVDGTTVSNNVALDTPGKELIEAVNNQWSAYNEGTASWDSICIRDGDTAFNCEAAPGSGINPTITLNTPTDNDHDSDILRVNFTTDDFPTGSEICNLTVNASVVTTLENVGNGTYWINWTPTSDNVWNYSVNCINLTVVSESRLYYYDTVNPIWSCTWPAEDNTTTTNAASDDLNCTVNDEYLNEVEVNVSCDGTTKFYNKSTGLVNWRNYTDTVTWGSLDNVSCQFFGNATDDHTAVTIKDYAVTKNQKDFYYTTSEGLHIRVGGQGNTVETWKSSDRYLFSFQSSGMQETYSVSCDGTLIPNHKRAYPSFVCNKINEIGGNWIDFNTDGINTWQYRKTKDGYDVIINYDKDAVTRTFSSVGGLNYADLFIDFLVDNVAPTLVNQTPVGNVTVTSTYVEEYAAHATDGGSMTAYLYTNETGSWALEETVSLPNDVLTSFNHTYIGAGLMLWNILVEDALGNQVWGTNKTTLIYNYLGVFENMTATSPTSGTVNTAFNVTANATCNNGLCKDVNATIDVSSCTLVGGYTATVEVGDITNTSSHAETWGVTCGAQGTYTFTVNYSIYNGSYWTASSSTTIAAAGGLTADEGSCLLTGTYVNGSLCMMGSLLQESQRWGGKMLIAVLSLLPIFLAIVFLVGANTLGEHHGVLKIFLYLLAPLMFIVSAHIASVGIIQTYDVPEVIETVADHMYYLYIVWGVIVTYFIIYGIYVMTNAAAQRKQDKLEY